MNQKTGFPPLYRFSRQRECRWAQRPGRETDTDVGFTSEQPANAGAGIDRGAVVKDDNPPAAQASTGDAPHFRVGTAEDGGRKNEAVRRRRRERRRRAWEERQKGLRRSDSPAVLL